jgi:DnaJ-class molecular chaperone
MNQVEHACHKCNGLGFELRDSGISKENPYEPYYFSLTCTECKGRGRIDSHEEKIKAQAQKLCNVQNLQDGLE